MTKTAAVRLLFRSTSRFAAGTLPAQPGPVAGIGWRFVEQGPPFASLDVEVTIAHDVSTNVKRYLKRP